MSKGSDFLVRFIVLILILFGTLMVVSTNVGNIAKDPYIIPGVLAERLFSIIVSHVLMAFFTNNSTIKRAQKLLSVPGIGTTVALFSTQLSEGVLGGEARIRIPIPGLDGMTIQPSRFAKVYTVIVVTVSIGLMAREREFKLQTVVRIPVYFFMVVAAVILLQRGPGTFSVLVLLYTICFLIPSYISLHRQQRWICLGLIVECVDIVFIMSGPVIDFLSGVEPLQHVVIRIGGTLNSFTDPHNSGYQPTSGLYDFARNGFTEVGLGNSIQKCGYLAQLDDDSILSIIVEGLGILGLMVVMLGYVVILQRLLYYTFHTRSEGYKVVLVGTAICIFTHFALNIGGVNGLIPLTGVPLPFISSGGSSLMSVMMTIGVSRSVTPGVRRQSSVAVSTATKQLSCT